MVSEQRTGIKTHFPELRNNKMIQLLHKYSCVCVCVADRELVGLAFSGHSSGHRFPSCYHSRPAIGLCQIKDAQFICHNEAIHQPCLSITFSSLMCTRNAVKALFSD